MTDTYNTIAETGEGLYKEKGSKFLAFAFPVQNEGEIKPILDQFKKEYYNARHICYAYRIGYDEQALFRMNDDGEPSGTAGKPIYGQILSHELTDVFIVVVRYFGGTKLGVSGLINAYKSAAMEAISATVIEEKIRTEHLTIHFDFNLTNEVMRIVKDQGLTVFEQHYDTACHLTLAVRLSEIEKIKGLYQKIHGVAIEEVNTIGIKEGLNVL